MANKASSSKRVVRFYKALTKTVAALASANFITACGPETPLGKDLSVDQLYGIWEQPCHEESFFGKQEYRIDKFHIKESAEIDIEFTFYEDSTCANPSRKQFIKGSFLTSQTVEAGLGLDISYSDFSNQPLSESELNHFNTKDYVWTCASLNWQMEEVRNCGEGNFTAYTSVQSIDGNVYFAWPSDEVEVDGSTPDKRLTSFLDTPLTFIGKGN